MSAALKQVESFDEVYDNIVKIYNHAENLLNLTYHESVDEHEDFISQIEPLVIQIEETANSIAADFTTIIESGQAPTNAMKRRVNSSLRKILNAIGDYKNQLKQAAEANSDA